MKIDAGLTKVRENIFEISILEGDYETLNKKSTPGVS